MWGYNMIIFDLIIEIIGIYVIYKILQGCCSIGCWHNKNLKKIKK
jgi:hypothetical protein